MQWNIFVLKFQYRLLYLRRHELKTDVMNNFDLILLFQIISVGSHVISFVSDKGKGKMCCKQYADHKKFPYSVSLGWLFYSPFINLSILYVEIKLGFNFQCKHGHLQIEYTRYYQLYLCVQPRIELVFQISFFHEIFPTCIESELTMKSKALPVSLSRLLYCNFLHSLLFH